MLRLGGLKGRKSPPEELHQTANLVPEFPVADAVGHVKGFDVRNGSETLFQVPLIVPLLRFSVRVSADPVAIRFLCRIGSCRSSVQGPLSVVGRQPNLRISDGSFSAVSTPILQANIRSKALDEIHKIYKIYMFSLFLLCSDPN